MYSKIKKRRNFFKISSVILLSLLTLDFNKFVNYKNLKKKGFTFFKKNKKVWILNQDDFK